MNINLALYLAVLPLAFGSPAIFAGDGTGQSHMELKVIALTTDDFELPETDISHLDVGEAETIVTDSGRTIDVLRTEEGVEIYIDGELMDSGGKAHHDGHKVVHKRVEVICADGDNCEESVRFMDDAEARLDTLDGDGHLQKVIVIKTHAES
jgi:hypothetical protein